MNFQIETTSFCNLTCPECPNWTMKRARTTMKLEVFETILRRYVVPYKARNQHCPPAVIMHKDGEPLLNKRLPEMLGLIADVDRSLSVDIYSHGLLLTRKFLQNLAALPLKFRLLVSFHFYNHDGTVNDYGATTELLKECLTGGWRPRNVEFILVSHLIRPMSRERLTEWKEGWAGIPNLTVHANVNINPWTGRIDEPGISTFESCPYGDFGHMFFGATGNIIACCMDLEEEIVFGNVMESDPEEMMDIVTAFYRDVTAKRLDHQVCRYCLGVEKRPEGATASAGVSV